MPSAKKCDCALSDKIFRVSNEWLLCCLLFLGCISAWLSVLLSPLGGWVIIETTSCSSLEENLEITTSQSCSCAYFCGLACHLHSLYSAEAFLFSCAVFGANSSLPWHLPLHSILQHGYILSYVFSFK